LEQAILEISLKNQIRLSKKIDQLSLPILGTPLMKHFNPLILLCGLVFGELNILKCSAKTCQLT